MERERERASKREKESTRVLVKDKPGRLAKGGEYKNCHTDVFTVRLSSLSVPGLGFCIVALVLYSIFSLSASGERGGVLRTWVYSIGCYS